MRFIDRSPIQSLYGKTLIRNGPDYGGRSAEQTPIHVRMWAALARNQNIISSDTVFEFLENSNLDQFWHVRNYPEIAELRALRFREFNKKQQTILLKRIRRLPPRSHWPREADTTKVSQARTYIALREMRRIELAGAEIFGAYKTFMDSEIVQFSPLQQMNRIDTDFPGMPKARWVQPSPDERFDYLIGADRIRALNAALIAPRRSWDENPADRARDWIRSTNNTNSVLNDFENTFGTLSEFPAILKQFFLLHKPTDEEPQKDKDQAKRGLNIIERLSEETSREVIEEIAHWFDAWKFILKDQRNSKGVWLDLWPMAVDATNARQMPIDRPNLSVSSEETERESVELDTLNNAVGNLIGFFLTLCSKIDHADRKRPFRKNSWLWKMRDAAISVTGNSKIIVQHRLIEHLSWFLAVDQKWTREKLIDPLQKDSEEALLLWQAVALNVRFGDDMSEIGESMVRRVSDNRLGRIHQESLAFSVIVETLHAFRQKRNSAVSNSNVQQMLRTVDDEIRAFVATIFGKFIREMSSTSEKNTSKNILTSRLFTTSVKPFLTRIWPQDRTFATPGVSNAFAELPSMCGDSFVDAANTVERFLVPFDCWSMMDFGISVGDEEGEGLYKIDNKEEAVALLKILDKTVGTSETSIVPDGLSTALQKISVLAPSLRNTPSFRRLSVASRRVD